MHVHVYINLDFAEEVLNKCVVSNPRGNVDDFEYSVLFNYEFLEDFRDDANDNEVTENTDESDSEDG